MARYNFICNMNFIIIKFQFQRVRSVISYNLDCSHGHSLFKTATLPRWWTTVATCPPRHLRAVISIEDSKRVMISKTFIIQGIRPRRRAIIRSNSSLISNKKFWQSDWNLTSDIYKKRSPGYRLLPLLRQEARILMPYLFTKCLILSLFIDFIYWF
jgi:hypothetical protein